MRSKLMTVFRKRVSCPSSQTLLAFLGSRLGCAEPEYIEFHLVTCDFCSAELQLLARHRSDTEESAFVEMPGQLRRLAESLLRRAAGPFSGLGRPQRQYPA
jgi:hypothetical protein